MARPNRTINVHTDLITHYRAGIREAMQLIAKKESLNVEDIQALRALGFVYESMLTLQTETGERAPGDCNSVDPGAL